MNHGDDEIAGSEWKVLYRIGGTAALVAAILFRRNLAEEFLFFRSVGIIHSGPTALPTNPQDWFHLLQTRRLIGLTFLNLFDAVNYALVGLIFLALYAALRHVNRSLMTLAIGLTLVSVTVYFA